MKAVQFGAGNIGRGFIGLVLARAGFEVVFADVNSTLVGEINAAGEYQVHEVGPAGNTETVRGVRAVDSGLDPAGLARELAEADLATSAVGPRVLPFIAPHLVSALRARKNRPPLVIMACENAIGATDQLRGAMRELVDVDEWSRLSARAIFANTAVDRIVPAQAPNCGLSVTVEDFSEWTVERTPFGGAVPNLPGVHFVDRLEPYIERKLFTVNTGHATAAYVGFSAGVELIGEVMASAPLALAVEAALAETSALLVAKHGFAPAEQAAYRARIMQRFSNPALPDTVARVGREPLRKLGRHERFIGPAAEAAERGLATGALLRAVAAALRFQVPGDPQSAQLQELLAHYSPAAFVDQVCQLETTHPLYPSLIASVAREREGN